MRQRDTNVFCRDEFGNTQYGNNNAYYQDNEISWLNWENVEKNRELLEFFRFMIALRREHESTGKILRQSHSQAFTVPDRGISSLPEIREVPGV